MRRTMVKEWRIEMRSDDSATTCGMLRSDDALVVASAKRGKRKGA